MFSDLGFALLAWCVLYSHFDKCPGQRRASGVSGRMFDFSKLIIILHIPIKIIV